jgi:3-hydroxyacyl-[acyl-carrier-protein] dehydratase
MIDRIKDMRDGRTAIGIKNVTINEPYFQGHFPNRPVMPGVLIIEAMAQTAIALVVHSTDMETDNKLAFFMSIDRARFRRPVVPGDTLEIPIELVKARGPVWKFQGRALVGGDLVAEAEFAAMAVDAVAK